MLWAALVEAALIRIEYGNKTMCCVVCEAVIIKAN